VFENRMLSTVFESKREEVTGYWRKLRNEEFYIMYPFSSVVEMIKSWGMKFAVEC
jgi:hypothetical protein